MSNGCEKEHVEQLESSYEFELCLAQTNVFGTSISTLLAFMLVKYSQVL